MVSSHRLEAVAWQFYPDKTNDLIQTIEDSFSHPLGPKKMSLEDVAFGFIAPHAGYVYSGPIAAHCYRAISSISEIETVIIVGPNHHALGSDVSVPSSKYWQTPLGNAIIDEAGVMDLARSSIIDIDDLPHVYEHSIEVQVPFLQYIFSSDIKILPICMLLQDRETAVQVGEAIAGISKGKSIIIASSDLTHYEPDYIAHNKDKELIKSIESLDIDAYYQVLEDKKVTACGYGAIAAVITAVKILGAKNGKLLRYATSGDTGGDKSSVVGYASIAFV